jgi:transposase-like protein
LGQKGYPAESRRRALDLVAAGKTVAEVARLLEVSDQSIDS